MPKKPISTNTIRRRPDGRYEGRYTGSDGKQHSVYGKTELAARKALETKLAEVRLGAWQRPEKMTVSEWYGIWKRDYLVSRAEKTRMQYDIMWRLHIDPMIGNMRMDKVTPMHCTAILANSHRIGLGSGSIIVLLGVMSAMFSAAKKAGIIASNPATGLDRPRKSKPVFNVIDATKMPEFISAVEQTHHADVLKFILFTGLRVGEACGLPRSAYNPAKRTLTVFRQISKSENGEYKFMPSKENKSREIVLSQRAIDIVTHALSIQYPVYTRDNISDGLLFRQRNGRHYTEATLYPAIKNIGKNIGIDALTIHDLRHSYAVAAIRAGVDVKTIQNNLGHTTAAMTLDVYAKYIYEMGEDAATRMDKYLDAALNG